MPHARFPATFAALAVSAALGCKPQPAPTKLPPKEVPEIQRLDDPTGERASVVEEAVQVGSNLAKVAYSCAPPSGKNVQGKGVLQTAVTSCQIDTSTKTVTLGSHGTEECPAFYLTLNDYHGAGTYNTASIGELSFGVARLRQDTCHWQGDLCMNWSRAGIHPEATCTIEVNGDGGLQYGTDGATISGTFVCSAFVSPFTGCAGVSAVAGCGITKGSFSVAGCAAVKAAPTPPPPQKPTAPAGKHKHGRG